jgi:hypothetical protein
VTFDTAGWCSLQPAYESAGDARRVAREHKPRGEFRAMRCPFGDGRRSPAHWHATPLLSLEELQVIARAIREGATVRCRPFLTGVPSASPKRIDPAPTVPDVTTKVIFRLPPERVAELDEAAAQEGRSRANFVATWIERVLEQKRAQSEAA